MTIALLLLFVFLATVPAAVLFFLDDLEGRL